MDASNAANSAPNWVAPTIEENSTKAFTEVKAGIYTATPVRKIVTKYGQQLIIKLESNESGTTEVSTMEVYVPNSYVKLLLSLFKGEVNHVHLLKYDGHSQVSLKNKKTINRYDIHIAPLPTGDKVVKLETPIKEQTWKQADTENTSW